VADSEEEDAEERERLDRFASWLVDGDDGDADKET
jgi:hypothetical protein